MGKRKLDQRGSKNPYWKGGISRERSNCVVCGKEFVSARANKRRYCSSDCWYASIRKPRVEMTCCVCGKKFVIKEYDKNRGHGQYCSKSCRSKVIGFSQLKGKPKTYEHRKKLSLSHSGENNYRWMGGKKKENITIRKGFEHRAWSKETLRFDNYTCVRCGKRGGALHAHHIVRFSEDVLSRFDQDNGITLCEECHHFVHSGEFLSRPEKYANSCSVRGDYAAVY